MIYFLKNNAIDFSKWDACIDRAINGNLYAKSWYLNIVHPGWCALVENDYERIFPLPVSRKAGIKYIMQPFFTQQLGLYYPPTHAEIKPEEFLLSIPEEYKYIDINLNTSNRLKAPFKTSDMTNMELDLNANYDKIEAGYQTNLKRNLKKAAFQKLSLTEHIQPEEIISMFRMNRGRDLQHLQESQYKIIERIAYESIHHGIGESCGVYDEYNQLIAGALWIKYHQKAIFLFSGLTENGKQMHAMPYMIDSFIRKNAGKALILDFEGSNDEGLARFYGSFGATRVFYQRFTQNKLPFPLKFGVTAYRRIRNLLGK